MVKRGESDHDHGSIDHDKVADSEEYKYFPLPPLPPQFILCPVLSNISIW